MVVPSIFLFSIATTVFQEKQSGNGFLVEQTSDIYDSARRISVHGIKMLEIEWFEVADRRDVRVIRFVVLALARDTASGRD